MPFFAASIESLIAFVVIMLLSALGQWMKQRKAQSPDTSEDEHPASPLGRRDATGRQPPPPLRPRPLFDLEGELRRLLGEEPEAPPAPAPPPIPRQAPGVPPTISPRPVTMSEPEDEFVPVSLPKGTHFPKPAPDLDAEPAPAFDLAAMAESASAYQRGGAVDTTAETKVQAARMQTAHARPDAPPIKARGRSPEAAAVVALLRQPRTARQAILASVILSPPKGIEGGRSGWFR